MQNFSPTGFFSSALKNSFIWELVGRNDRQIDFASKPSEEFNTEMVIDRKKYSVRGADVEKVQAWQVEGFEKAMKTPDDSLIFVTADKCAEIRKDQADCVGCLSQCRFSSWATNEKNSTGRLADPRSFCIQKTLEDVAKEGSIDNNLVFAGHNAFRFGTDPFYSNGFVPTVKQLVDRIITGD